ncbi:MAG: protein kinase [Alphaproteobacteria bacterium]|nr:protein kinase [Alphaproteobacteria bacterium]
MRIGRFEVRERLGRGGMGTVYRAFDPVLQRDVALKAMEGDLGDQADRVRDEARALARLTHPNVVAVHELGVEAGQVFVAMEHVQGPNLGAWAATLEPAVRPAAVLEAFIQAGMGLQAAHDAGLVHRDIKPENLLRHADGRVVVADFGLAVLEGSDEGVVAGTPPFIAPEVLEHGTAGPSSDQFAFAASLWRLLDPEAALRDRDARIDPIVKDALIRALDPDPDVRWSSVRALLQALVAARAPDPSARRRAVLLERVQRVWIDGVLAASLRTRSSFALPLAWVPEAEDAPPSLLAAVEEAHGFLLVLGEPGGGKSTLLLKLADAMLQNARIDPGEPVPVVLLLASLADRTVPLERWVEDELVAKYGLPRPDVAPWIRDGTLALLLDGLDEVAPEQRGAVVEKLEAFRREHGSVVVVTSREAEHDALARRLSANRAVRIGPVPEGAAEVAGLPGAARTPLMLTLLAGSDAAPPDGSEVLPWLYGRFVDHALSDLPPVERTTLLDGLGSLAAAMTRSDRTEIWLEELQPAWLFPDGPRMLAYTLGTVLLTLICVGVNLAVSVTVEGDALSGLIFGLCSVPTILVFNGGWTIRPTERLRYSWRRLVRLALPGLAMGLTVGAIYGMFYVLWVNLVFGAVAGLVVVTTLAFEPSLREGRLRPNEGIRRSAWSALLVGSMGFVLGGGVLGYVAVPAVLPYLEPPSTLVGLPHPERSAAAVAGPMLGLIAGMVRGGWAVVMHLALRVVLAATTPLPLRLVPLLEAAADRGLLRRVGGGYLFLHRSFQRFVGSRAAS